MHIKNLLGSKLKAHTSGTTRTMMPPKAGGGGATTATSGTTNAAANGGAGSNQPPTEVNLSFEDQQLLDRTDMELLAVEDAYHEKHGRDTGTPGMSLQRKGSGRYSHGVGTGGIGGIGSPGEEKKEGPGVIVFGGDSAMVAAASAAAAQTPQHYRETSTATSTGTDEKERRMSNPRSQMDLILSAGRRSGGKSQRGQRGGSGGTGGGGEKQLSGGSASGGGGPGPDRDEDKERSKRFAEERRMKMEFQRGDSELGHPVSALPPPPSSPSDHGGIPRDISIASASSALSTASSCTGLDGPSAPTLLMQNPEHMAAPAPAPALTVSPAPAAARGRSGGSATLVSMPRVAEGAEEAAPVEPAAEDGYTEETEPETTAAAAAEPEPELEPPLAPAAAAAAAAVSESDLGNHDSARDMVSDLPTLRSGGFERNSSFSPNAATIDLSTRSAPFLLSQQDLILGRDTSVATAATTMTRSDADEQDIYANDAADIEDEVYGSTRTDSGALCKVRRINLLIDQVESARFPFKKKLILANMNLTSSDLPIDDICSNSMCQSMNKLSLAGNRLGHVPDKIVLELTGLRTLDLSQCDLRSLPKDWSLPHLKRLDLSHNRLVDFPDESILKGLPELQHLDMYGNKVAEISIPHDCQVLVKLDHLNMGYNNLQALPDDLNSLTSLRTLKIMNNVIEKIPEQVCEMDLRVIDVSSNPLIQPPVETCERGICSMRRYYHCLKLEEKSRQRMLDEIHKKSEAKKQRKDKTRSMMRKKKDATLAVFGLGGLGKGKTVGREEEASGSEHTGGGSSQLSSSPPTSLTAEKRMSSAPTRGTLSRSAPSHGFLSPNSRSVKTMADSGPPLRSKTVGSSMASSPNLMAHSKKLSLDSPIEKKIFALEKVKARTPSDGVEMDEARLRDAGMEEKLPTVNDVYYKPGQESFMSLASDSQDMAEEALAAELEERMPTDTINDTLKVIFVGMAMTGKTSIIKRLLEGKNAVIPKREERTVGVDIYNWDPKNDGNSDRGHIDTSIKIEDELLERTNGDVDVKFSLWDFAGQHVYHATHELFFSPRALYILVWDMGITNSETHKQKRHSECSQGAFKLSYDSSDDEDDPLDNDESRRADRELERDIDEKVQFWVDCIQSSAPGAAILPVASFDDYFDDNLGWGVNEAKRRCAIMRDRLLKHEEKRVKGLQERLEAYERGHRANSEAALRLRKLLCPFCRPKLVFGSDGSVVRVSGAKYTGFDRLSEKLVNIATGRDLGGWDYPIFRGHVGARIPRMRLEVRDIVRDMRDRFKVVEWGYFINTLRKKGLHNVEDVSDALHFLTNIGELSYFGDVIKDFGSNRSRVVDEDDEDDDDEDSVPRCPDPEEVDRESRVMSPEDEDYEDEEAYVFPMDRVVSDPLYDDDKSYSVTASMSSTSVESLASGLSQFIFLNPRWLVAAVACILRHDLNREINETRRLFNKKQLIGWDSNTLNGDDFYVAHLNCPVVTAEDACMLWQAKKIINKAAERALQYSNNMTMSPFDFLQRLLIRFRVFVPIDLDIEKAMLGGKEYGRSGDAIEVDETTSLELNTMTENDARFFFLPSLLGPGEPSEVWSYKNSDSWKTTVCHSILFPDGVPPGLMERITATVLSDIYSVTQNTKQEQNAGCNDQDKMSCAVVLRQQGQSRQPALDVGQLFVKEILCWRSSFYLKLGMEISDPGDGEVKESVVEIFCALLDKDSHLCVSSDFMGVGMRRLVLSGKGQIGEGGRKIWRGGYTLVIRAIGRVMEEYGGLEFEKQGICPECLAKRPVSRASLWDWSLIRTAAHNGDETMRCQIGHRVDTRLITGMCTQPQSNQVPLTREKSDRRLAGADHIVPVTDLLRGVVVVGLWDGKTDKIVRVGSGFVADKKRGLIVTASHTLMNIWGDSRSPYGENYYGLRSAKVVIGVIPRERSSDSIDSTTAVFRYFATIVAKDENIDTNGVCHMDACVLRITTRLEQDVAGNGDGCAEQPEILLVNTPEVFKKERLHQLKVSNREAELEEQVRILGYNQGGEGLVRKGMNVNRVADFARGYVCMKFHTDVEEGWAKSRRFKPKEEIVVMCPTIGGHSGGPCVNQSGEVIGILSRADDQRCYLVPAKAWRGLVKQAKHSQYI